VLTNVEVVVIFWGVTGAAPPGSGGFSRYLLQCFTGIVTGPYMTGLEQYRGVGPGTMLGQFVNTTPPDPANPIAQRCGDDAHQLFAEQLVVSSATGRAQPVLCRGDAANIGNTLGAEGEHLNFTLTGPGLYAWITDDGQGLTQGTSNGVVNTSRTNWRKPAQILCSAAF